MVLRGCIAFLILSSLVCTARAADAPQASHPCAALSKAVERLACYDKAFGAPTTATPASAASQEQEFGRAESLAAAKEARARAGSELASIAAKVVEVTQNRSGEYIVKLDNGQTWMQVAAQSRVDIDVGDSIAIRRATLGSFLLVTKDRVGTRVRRVN
jgi:hypothetical protein